MRAVPTQRRLVRREPVGKPPGYQLVHIRLKRSRGPACDHLCRCGQPAKDWAYLGGAPHELHEVIYGRRLAYSTDPSFYAALCRSCHMRLDRPGAKLTPEDVITIRSRWPDITKRQLASEYGVTSMTVGNIINRRTWLDI